MNTPPAGTDEAKTHARDALRGRWTLGLVIVGGSVFGFMQDWEALSPALRHRPFSYNSSHDALSTLGSLLGDFALPVAVSFIAPRKSFFWAAATLGVGLAWSLMDRVVTVNGPGFLSDLENNGVSALATLLIFCSPISLVRLGLRRRRDGRLRRIAEQQAWMQASEAQAGVWPPPIKRTEQN